MLMINLLADSSGTVSQLYSVTGMKQGGHKITPPVAGIVNSSNSTGQYYLLTEEEQSDMQYFRHALTIVGKTTT